jgi:hypothetical protein
MTESQNYLRARDKEPGEFLRFGHLVFLFSGSCCRQI